LTPNNGAGDVAGESVSGEEQEEVYPDETGKSSLGLTVAVGCALLILNVCVFLATFCQWHRTRRTMRAHKMHTISRTATVVAPDKSGRGSDDQLNMAVEKAVMEADGIASVKLREICQNYHQNAEQNHSEIRILNYDQIHRDDNSVKRRSMELSQTNLVQLRDVEQRASPVRTFGTFFDADSYACRVGSLPRPCGDNGSLSWCSNTLPTPPPPVSTSNVPPIPCPVSPQNHNSPPPVVWSPPVVIEDNSQTSEMSNHHAYSTTVL